MTISSAAEAPETEIGTSRTKKWVIALFFVVLFIPGSFYVGVRMTPYRLYLIVMALPMVLRFRSDPTLRITAVDMLVFLAIAWRTLALMANHQTEQIVNAGSIFIELFFGYMLGRVFIRSAEDYRFLFKCFLVTLLAFLPFALLEFATRRRILSNLFGAILVQQPPGEASDRLRYGFMRVQLPFNHAIHYGVFCAMGFANLFYLYLGRFPRYVLYPGFAAFMAFLALSSSSILNIALQGGLIVYERVLRPFPFKWIVLGAAMIVLWFSFEIIFGKTIPEYLVTELVINRTGAEGRLDQITYGIKEVYRYPVFGIGMDDPALPFWRGTVIDNFWLTTAVRYGVPASLFIALAFAVHFLKIALSRQATKADKNVRLAYMIPFVTLVLALGSLSIYGIMLVFVMVYLGAGAWFYDSPSPRRRPEIDRRKPSPAEPAGAARGSRRRR